MSDEGSSANGLDRPEADDRLDTFVDAAFAFALTMLVVSIDRIPSSLDELLTILKDIPAFAVSFLQVMLFWVGHRRWRRMAGHTRASATAWSLGLVFTVLVYLYPLKLMFSMFFHWLSAGALPGGFDNPKATDMPVLFAIFSVGMAAMAACLAGLFHSSIQGQREARQPEWRRGRVAWLLVTLMSVVVAVICLTMPLSVAIWAPWGFVLLAFTTPISNRLSMQRASD